MTDKKSDWTNSCLYGITSYFVSEQFYFTGADPNVRDWSGRKPRQYQTNKDTSVSADTFRSEYPHASDKAPRSLPLRSQTIPKQQSKRKYSHKKRTTIM